MGLSGTGKLSLKERSQYKSGILWALGPQMSSAWVPGPPLVLTFRHKKEFKMPQNNLLWTYSDWAGNISCGSHTRRHKSMGFPWPKVMPLAAGEKKCFQNKLKKKNSHAVFPVGQTWWASAGAASTAQTQRC